MNVILSTLNSKYIHSSLAPWCLFAACRNYCKGNHALKVIEGTVNEKPDTVLSRITDEKSEAVAFSVYIWNKKKTLDLCERIKNVSPDTIIILGGPEVAYCQEEILESHSFIDYILSGEGEIILTKLLDYISDGLSPEDIDGVSFRKKDELIVRNEAIGESFDYPSPYCNEFLNALKGRIAYIETSRGCPFSCAYCLSGRCGKVRFKDMNKVKAEILTLANSGTKTVKFVDRTFNCNNTRAIEILRFIRENRGKAIPESVCFHFEISADILKDDFIKEVGLAEKGLFQFEIGIQSTNPATLNAIGRKSDTKKLFCNIRKLIALRNCHIHTDLIAGLPEESLTSFIKGFNESFSLKADMLQPGFLKLLHGSHLRSEESKFTCEFSSDAPYEVISTPTMTKEDLLLIHKAEKEVDRLYNSGRFRRTINYVLESTSLTPFELFSRIGSAFSDILPDDGVPLDAYTNALFELIKNFDGVDTYRLRDTMLCDRIITVNSSIIPESLRTEDRRMKKVRAILGEHFPVNKGTSRTVGILYSMKKVIFTDRTKKDPITGEYSAEELDFDFFGETFFDFDIDK